MKIYTKTGDKGKTGLLGGLRVSKAAYRLEAYGTVDELNSFLGLCGAHSQRPELKEWVAWLQPKLFVLGSELANPEGKVQIETISSTDSEHLEKEMDRLTEALPPLRHFVLPGGSLVASYLHVARTVCRRAERCVVRLEEQEPIAPPILIFLNRLSDFLFLLARQENHFSKTPEVLWLPEKPPPKKSDHSVS